MSLLVFGVIGSFLTGLLQWFILQGRIRQAIWWLLAGIGEAAVWFAFMLSEPGWITVAIGFLIMFSFLALKQLYCLPTQQVSKAIMY